MSEAKGDCYEAAVHTMLDLNKDVRPYARLCHGTVVGNAEPVLGVPFGHAWVEVGGAVLDNSNGGSTITPMERYYQRGSIEPATVTRYTYDEMCLAMVKARHYGPWH